MINSTFGGYMIARSGLTVSQQGLYLTGQNLTNTGTYGYTRQRLDQISLNYGGNGKYASKYATNIGNGALVTGTSQLRDPFLDLRYRNEVAHVGEQNIKLDALNDLKNILDEVKNSGDTALGDGGIFNQLGQIKSALTQLSLEVGNKEFDTIVKSACQTLVTLFNSYSGRIEEIEKNMSYDLENVDVPRANKILESIKDLNIAIKNSEIKGDSALELKDQRNLLIDELSNYMKIDVSYKPIQVSDHIIVDELQIDFVGKDGKNYTLVKDEQTRQFELSKKGEDWNLGLTSLSPIDSDLKSELIAAENALKKATDILANSEKTFNDAYDDYVVKKFPQLQQFQTDAAAARKKATGDDGKGGLYGDWQKAVEAFNTELVNPNPDKTKLDALRKARDEARTKYYEAEKEAKIAESKAKDYEKEIAPSKTAFEKALENLDTDKPDPPLNGPDGKPLVGGGKARKTLDAAQQRVDDDIKALEQSDAKGVPIDSINSLLTNGMFKGSLDMLNSAGEFDNPPSDIRGVKYYKNMLDTLANQFATEMNKANNPYQFANGPHDLFASTDGSKITAGNIKIADGWVDNTYGITASDDPNAPLGNNKNVLHMISVFGEKLDYKADVSLKNDMVIQKSPTIKNMKNGDTVTIDGKKYTFVDKADGSTGNEFSDITSLQTAAQKNGVTITEDPATGEISATTTAIDLKSTVLVNDAPVKSLADIDVTKMSYGDTITVDGKTFTFKPKANGADGKTFSDINSLIAASDSKNIVIATDPKGTITGVTQKPGEKLDVSVKSSPSIDGMQPGETITINDGKNTYVYEKGKDFNDMDELIERAEKDGITIFGDKNTGEITSITKVGSKLFDGTFEEYFTNIGMVLGIDTQSTTDKLKSHTNLAGNISDSRESVTGVSLDEEAMNIMRYQQSYQASSRLLTALDEMVNILITQTGIVGR